MNIINLLLETDAEKLRLDTKKEYEIKRLSEILGEKFVVTCSALTSDRVAHVAEISRTDELMRLNTILESCRLEGKKFNDEQLMEKFGVATPTDLLRKLFLAGEVLGLYEYVSEMSGYRKDAVREVKNS